MPGRDSRRSPGACRRGKPRVPWTPGAEAGGSRSRKAAGGRGDRRGPRGPARKVAGAGAEGGGPRSREITGPGRRRLRLPAAKGGGSRSRETTGPARVRPRDPDAGSCGYRPRKAGEAGRGKRRTPRLGRWRIPVAGGPASRSLKAGDSRSGAQARSRKSAGPVTESHGSGHRKPWARSRKARRTRSRKARRTRSREGRASRSREGAGAGVTARSAAGRPACRSRRGRVGWRSRRRGRRRRGR